MGEEQPLTRGLYKGSSRGVLYNVSTQETLAPCLPPSLPDPRGRTQNRTFFSFLSPDLENGISPWNINCHSVGDGPLPF